jgi:hypothetical protein
MRSVVLALILVFASAPTAEAGAWLREKGKGFTSSSLQTTDSAGTSGSLYAEYGLSKGITVGLDATYDTDLATYLTDRTTLILNEDGTFPQGSAVVFFRFPLGPTDQVNKWAYHIGLGVRYENGELAQAAEVGLSWGRGIQWRDRYGWINVDTSYNSPEDPLADRIKIDATVGLGLTQRLKGMLQVFNTIQDGETYTKIAPSLLVSLGKGGTTLQLSSEIPVSGGGGPSIKLGLWYEF